MTIASCGDIVKGNLYTFEYEENGGTIYGCCCEKCIEFFKSLGTVKKIIPVYYGMQLIDFKTIEI